MRRPERDLGYPVSRPVAPDPRRVRWRRNKPAGTFRGSDGPGTMTGVSAILAMRGPRFGIRAAPGFLAMTVVAPGGFAVQRLPVRAVGQYPPLGWSRRALFGAAIPEPRRLRQPADATRDGGLSPNWPR